MKINDLCNSALQFAEGGIYVLPLHGVHVGQCTCGNRQCTLPGRHARIEPWEKAVSRYPQELIKWWSRWPDANIGLAMGSASGLVALEVTGTRGHIALELLMEELDWSAETLTIDARDGDRYVLLKYPSDVSIRGGRIAPGIELLSDGSLIPAPSSRDENGYFYCFDNVELPISPIPASLFCVLGIEQRAA
jgi:putative DNA primase/helicase